MKEITSKILADSKDDRGNRITSFLCTLPQIVAKELLRHRMLSFSSASMRAIPFEKNLQDVMNNPFIPIAFQKDHTGMQGTAYLNPNTKYTYSDIIDIFHRFCFSNNYVFELDFRRRLDYKITREEKTLADWWLFCRDMAVQSAIVMHSLGVSKQLCNRIIEPFGYVNILVTGTEWTNFFELRCPKYKKEWLDTFNGLLGILKTSIYKSKYDWSKENHNNEINNWSIEKWYSVDKSGAEIHIQALAESMWDNYNSSTPKLLKEGDWHLPFGDKIDTDLNKWFSKVDDKAYWWGKDITPLVLKVVTARCARLSYNTFNGKINYEKDLALADKLAENKHWSPFEHCARCMTELEYYSMVKGKIETSKDAYGIFNYEYYPVAKDDMMGFIGVNEHNGNKYGWCNNLRGFIPYRYIIENNLNA